MPKPSRREAQNELRPPKANVAVKQYLIPGRTPTGESWSAHRFVYEQVDKFKATVMPPDSGNGPHARAMINFMVVVCGYRENSIIHLLEIPQASMTAIRSGADMAPKDYCNLVALYNGARKQMISTL